MRTPYSMCIVLVSVPSQSIPGSHPIRGSAVTRRTKTSSLRASLSLTAPENSFPRRATHNIHPTNHHRNETTTRRLDIPIPFHPSPVLPFFLSSPPFLPLLSLYTHDQHHPPPPSPLF
ncbi:hypothetical protein BO82DRAFT_54256 [Aspergillus uvarum CBS 121591]|uniref:Uncharacterized protein n=1 Tax=Aspergillus uvarum CBS 121591 TaxID=1448315 RepID=A0A319CWZ9_9EURO|nr:hypothetical protein BO82DRAFT_54256 [Aspergillus uvarum CBS 121591]PYH86927.1 hypothetical protein BO82DRAFT_54256 [Aspergillus uvarum CBS 121591]